jgi:hypothetical protein
MQIIQRGTQSLILNAVCTLKEALFIKTYATNIYSPNTIENNKNAT